MRPIYAVRFQVHFQREPIRLQPKGGQSLQAILRSTRRAAGRARRVRVLLFVADGTRLRQIQAQTGMSPRRGQQRRRCWQQQGLDGLRDAPRSGRPKNLTPEKEAAILVAIEKPPLGVLTHGSTHLLARQLGVSCGTVVRVGHRVALQRRPRRYRASPDPDLEANGRDILGLYLDPPKHAAVACVDEKTAIQALGRRFQYSLGQAPNQTRGELGSELGKRLEKSQMF